MTQAQAALLLETKLQTRGYLLYGNLVNEEINLFLLKATNDFIDAVLTNDHDDREVSQDYLRQLRKLSDPINPASSGEGYVAFTLPTDYRDYIKFQAETSSTNCEKKWRSAEVIDSERVLDLNEDSYSGTKINSVNVLLEADTAKLFYDSSFTIHRMRVLYYKEPDAWELETKGNEKYSLSDKAINRIIDTASVEIASFLEQRQDKIANLKGV